MHIDSKCRDGKKYFHSSRNQNKAGVAILISDKIDFKPKTVPRHKEGHYIMIKGSIHQEDTIIINKYALNIGSLKYIKQILADIKGETGNKGIVVRDFKCLSTTDRSSRQNINKKMMDLNYTLNQMDLIDIYRIHILLKCPWKIFKDRSYNRKKTSFSKFKKIKIIPNYLF